MAILPTSYPLSFQHWRKQGAVQVYDSSNKRLCTIPIGALQDSGDLNWDFIFYCIDACVESPGYLFSNAGEELVEVDKDSPVMAGKYIFQQIGMIHIL